MRDGRRFAEAALAAGLVLWLWPGCGRNEMSSQPDASRDGPADPPADRASDPPVVTDTIPPVVDLPPTPDLPADRIPDSGPGDPAADTSYRNDPLPTTDPMPADRSGDAVPLPDSPADRPGDLRVRDAPPVPDLIVNFDMPPAYDQILVTDPVLQRDSYVVDGGSASELCIATGGTLGTQTCCPTVADFRDMCSTAAGACGCSPANSVTVRVCVCPQPSCFLPAYGCVGPGATCTVGMNQTCNDNSIISSVRGRCVENGRCVCTTGMSTSSGKCL